MIEKDEPFPEEPAVEWSGKTEHDDTKPIEPKVESGVTDAVDPFRKSNKTEASGEVVALIKKEKIRTLRSLKRVKFLSKKAIKQLASKQKVAVEGVWTQELRHEQQLWRALSHTRIFLHVVGIDTAFDHESRIFRITAYDGASNEHVPNNSEIIAATHCAYGHTITPCLYSLPSIYRIKSFKWITDQIHLAFGEFVKPYETTLRKIHSSLETIPLSLFYNILYSIPGCKEALESDGETWPHEVVSRVALVPYLASGGPELSETVDVLGLECLFNDALLVAGKTLGCGAAVQNLSILLTSLKAFEKDGKLKDFEWFFEFLYN